MKKFSIILILSFIVVNSNAQSDSEKVIISSDKEEAILLKEQPEFPGGMVNFTNYISKNIKYPIRARRKGIEGRVYVQFIVDKSGKISDVTVIKGIGYGCDEEAVRLFVESPNWTPGKVNGKPVKVRLVIPIVFWLEK